MIISEPARFCADSDPAPIANVQRYSTPKAASAVKNPNKNNRPPVTFIIAVSQLAGWFWRAQAARDLAFTFISGKSRLSLRDPETTILRGASIAEPISRSFSLRTLRQTRQSSLVGRPRFPTPSVAFDAQLLGRFGSVEIGARQFQGLRV